MWAAKMIVSIAIAAVFSATALTVWATVKSSERTACYHTAKVVEDCEQPNAVEKVIRSLLAPGALKTPNSKLTYKTAYKMKAYIIDSLDKLVKFFGSLK